MFMALISEEEEETMGLRSEEWVMTEDGMLVGLAVIKSASDAGVLTPESLLSGRGDGGVDRLMLGLSSGTSNKTGISGLSLEFSIIVGSEFLSVSSVCATITSSSTRFSIVCDSIFLSETPKNKF